MKSFRFLFSFSIILSFLGLGIPGSLYSQSSQSALVFIAQEDGKISLIQVGSPSTPSLVYKHNTGSWTSYNIGVEIDVKEMDVVQFKTNTDRGEFSKSADASGTGSGNDYFKFVTTGKVNLMGNVMYLLYTDGSTTHDSVPPYAFAHIFNGCKITDFLGFDADLLPAKKLSKFCYFHMFDGCEELTSAPRLPAKVLKECCYDGMFKGCKSLESFQTTYFGADSMASDADYCCMHMFNGCSSLTSAPEILNIKTLRDGCYYGMFEGCSSLKTAPILPAENLVRYCYREMFKGCSSLNMVSVGFKKWFMGTCYTTTPLTYNIRNEATDNWLEGVATTGEFFHSNISIFPTSSSVSLCPDVAATYQEYDFVPSTWTKINRSDATDGLILKSGDANNEITLTIEGNVTADLGLDTAELEYRVISRTSAASVSWTPYKIGDKITLPSKDDSLIFRAVSSNSFESSLTAIEGIELSVVPHYHFTSTQPFSLEGNIIYVLAFNGKANAIPPYAFNQLFKGCRVTSVADNFLPDKEVGLESGCYAGMFAECTSLTNAPQLKATKVGSYSYREMFKGCTSLVTPPVLPADTIGAGCYISMFEGCTSLNPSSMLLPSVDLPLECYNAMFKGCTSMTSCPILGRSGIPSNKYKVGINSCKEMFANCSALTSGTYLSADTLQQSCYEAMFKGCTSMTRFYSSIDELPARGLAQNCYRSMFSGCTSLTAAPKLQADSLAKGCCAYMFEKCSALNKVPSNLPRNLEDSCYAHMFEACTSLPNSHFLPILALKCKIKSCEYMFKGCSSLTSILDKCYDHCFISNDTSNGNKGQYDTARCCFYDNCFAHMYENCTNLTSIPVEFKIGNIGLGSGIFEAMFKGCTGLRESPQITFVGQPGGFDSVCVEMFAESGISSIGTITSSYCAPSLFEAMFKNCKNITEADLSQIKLQKSASIQDEFKEMFMGCSRLNKITVNFSFWSYDNSAYSTLLPWVEFTTDWVKDVAANGTFECPLELPVEKNESRIPTLWNLPLPEGVSSMLILKAVGSDAKITIEKVGTFTTASHTFSYVLPTDRGEFTLISGAGSPAEKTFSISKDDALYLRAVNDYSSKFSEGNSTYFRIKVNSGKVELGGELVSLVAPLSVSSLPDNCFVNLFKDEKNLEVGEDFSITVNTLGSNALHSTFEGCTGITRMPTINSSNARNSAMKRMFYGCTKLATMSYLSFISMGESAFEEMFSGCTALTSASMPSGLSSDIPKNLCKKMFYGCTQVNFGSLSLNASDVNESAFESTFENCSNLNNALSISLTNLGKNSCKNMFKGCSKLQRIAQLAVSSAADSSMQSMFENCSELNEISRFTGPSTVSQKALYDMFKGCTKLTDVSSINLPARTLANSCYAGMFESCTALTETPALPATTLASNCYDGMFSGCSSLLNAPALPATTLQTGCYNNMFANCSKLISITVSFASWTSGTTTGWVSGVNTTNGHFYCPITLPVVYGSNNIPTNWGMTIDGVIDPNQYYLCFTASKNDTKIKFNSSTTSAPDLLYYTSADNSKGRLGSSEYTLNTNDKLYVVANKDNSTLQGCSFSVTGEASVTGNILSLLYVDRGTPSNNQALANNNLPISCFSGLFKGCKITSAPILPTKQLINGSEYKEMFANCNILVNVPQLPATTLSKSCYEGMFSGCTALKDMPQLGATDVKDSSYKAMFKGDTSLVYPSNIRAQKVGKSSFESMFEGCTALKGTPIITASDMAENCYKAMFKGCREISMCQLPATKLANGCYDSIFNGCSKLNFIQVGFTTWPTTISATKGWVKDVAASGTFNGPCHDTYGESDIPSSNTNKWDNPRCTDTNTETTCTGCTKATHYK